MKKCSKSLFIFDEIEKMPAGILDSLSSQLENHHSINGVNYRQGIFIFVSNIEGRVGRFLHHFLLQINFLYVFD